MRFFGKRSGRLVVEAGTVLFEEGDAAEQMFLVRRGALEVFKTVRHHEQHIALRGAGEVVGEMALLGAQSRTASVRARESTVVRSLDKACLLEVLRTHPEMGLLVIERLVGRMKSSQQELAEELTSRIEELEQLNGQLEARVAQRTEQLNNANRQLAQAAETDFLTKCFNRRFLQAELTRRCVDPNRFALFMMDIDHFKKYNDTHGHVAGDHLLQDFAETVRSNLRGQDVLARYGGEEFVCILEIGLPQEAFATAERIRAAVASKAFAGMETQPLGCISLSGGVSLFPEEDRDADALLRRADERLYEAKEGGRNRLVLPQAG